MCLVIEAVACLRKSTLSTERLMLLLGVISEEGGRTSVNDAIGLDALFTDNVTNLARYLVEDGSDENYLHNLRTRVVPIMERVKCQEKM